MIVMEILFAMNQIHAKEQVMKIIQQIEMAVMRRSAIV